MQLKDHYTILEIAPSATLEEIKKAYRRLAHIYHPDKKTDDPYALAHFNAIKEAYETLTNPVKREYYLQQRWYAKSTGRIQADEIVTPVLLLKKMLELDRYVSALDVHRMDAHSLAGYAVELLSDNNIQVVLSFNEQGVNKEIGMAGLGLLRRLPYSFTPGLATQLKKLDTDGSFSNQVDRQMNAGKRADWWDKKRTWLVLLLALLLCVLIFFASS